TYRWPTIISPAALRRLQASAFGGRAVGRIGSPRAAACGGRGMFTPGPARTWAISSKILAKTLGLWRAFPQHHHLHQATSVRVIPTAHATDLLELRFDSLWRAIVKIAPNHDPLRPIRWQMFLEKTVVRLFP